MQDFLFDVRFFLINEMRRLTTDFIIINFDRIICFWTKIVVGRNWTMLTDCVSINSEQKLALASPADQNFTINFGKI